MGAVSSPLGASNTWTANHHIPFLGGHSCWSGANMEAPSPPLPSKHERASIAIGWRWTVCFWLNSDQNHLALFLLSHKIPNGSHKWNNWISFIGLHESPNRRNNGASPPNNDQSRFACITQNVCWRSIQAERATFKHCICPKSYLSGMQRWNWCPLKCLVST